MTEAHNARLSVHVLVDLAPRATKTIPARQDVVRYVPNQISAAVQVNMALVKSFPFKEHYKFKIRGEAFNLGNMVIYAPPSTDFNSANFEQLLKTQYNFPRVAQFAGKFYF